MTRLMAMLAMVLATSLPIAAGHGGLYRGPGPGLPAPGGPGGGPGTPGPLTPAGGGGGGGVVSGGGSFYAAKKSAAPSYTDWYTWWEFNREPYLDLRRRLESRYAVTGEGQHSVRPGFDELSADVIPHLLKLLASDDADIVDSAVLAIARCTPADRSVTVFDALVGALRHDERSVKQSTILALGVLGDPRAVPILQEILTDSKAGQQALKLTRSCDATQRGMAAIALGYLSDPASISILFQEFTKGNGNVDVQAAIVLGLGLFDGSPTEIVTFLGEVLDDARANDVVRAQVPIALFRLGEVSRAAFPALLRLLNGRRTENLVRQSCAIALGRLGTPEDIDAIAGLKALVEHEKDDGAANFAMIALGRICGAAATEPARHAEMLKEVDRLLLRQLTRPRTKQLLPFAATACALVARSYPADHAQRAVYVDKLLEAWNDTKQPEHVAALSIALGLSGSAEAGKLLLKRFLSSSDRTQNGYLAEALGLMRYGPAQEALLKRLADDADPTYRVKLAVGLGLMGNRDVSEQLVGTLREARTLWVTSSAARAIGRVGDRGAIAPLDAIAADAGRPGMARGFACVAIGLIGEKTLLPWNTRLADGANYLAAFPIQSEVLDIL